MFCRINWTGTGAIVECIISVGLVLGLYHISRNDSETEVDCRISWTDTWTVVVCIVSIGLALMATRKSYDR